VIREALVREADRLLRPAAITEVHLVPTQDSFAEHEPKQCVRPLRVRRGECVRETLRLLIREVIAASHCESVGQCQCCPLEDPVGWVEIELLVNPLRARLNEPLKDRAEC
jgi:hypothetical protein